MLTIEFLNFIKISAQTMNNFSKAQQNEKKLFMPKW